MRIIGQSKKNRGSQTKIYIKQKMGMYRYVEKRKMLKLKIAERQIKRTIIKISCQFYLLQRTYEVLSVLTKTIYLILVSLCFNVIRSFARDVK